MFEYQVLLGLYRDSTRIPIGFKKRVFAEINKDFQDLVLGSGFKELIIFQIIQTP